ncbi:MAG TPA: ATP-binding protein [Methylomirabilota bacterium]|jgi:two-component system phosphate regulon sensor histidine kinase PhoR|nr:ATP-binding protein [Methylomirabilota bacterium]
MAMLLRTIRRSIALKLTLTLIGFVAISGAVAGLYLSRALQAFAVESLETRLGAVAAVAHEEAAAALRSGTPASMQELVGRIARSTGARVTLIAPDGRVLGESARGLGDLAAMDNHADRPEVRAALAGRQGRDLRHSTTIAAPLLYVAVPVRVDGRLVGALRLALPVSAVTASYATLHQVMLAGGAVTLLVALGIGVFVAGRVTRPVVEMQSIARQMSEGSFLVRAPTGSTDEIGMLGRSLNVMAGRLREKIGDLGQEQAKVTAILDAMVEGVVAVDGQEHVLLMNEQARAMFALGSARGEGKPFLEVIRNADLHEIFRAVHAGGEAALQREIELTSPPRILGVNAVRLAASGDRSAAGPGVVLVLHDVTALRQLERVRTEFVANVSHELRTPLTAIQGYLETLLSGALEERENARRFLEIALRHSERLGRLLNDLTDLSNIELGKVALRREPVRVDEVVASVVGIIAPRAARAKVDVTSHVPPDLPQVPADRDRLAQILINLVDNAVKYTPEGGSVTVTARRVAESTIETAVTDTGIGIPPADLPRITERFYRVDRARSRELGGTGLGLAIVKHLVMAHGGQLGIESEQERGTSVRFTLPIEPPAV